MGHSYGTYVAINAAYQRPELYRAYVGIGQVSNKTEAELDNLNKYISAAEAYLEALICHQSKEFVLFEDSAHFPQFEERELFFSWLCEHLIDGIE